MYLTRRSSSCVAHHKLNRQARQANKFNRNSQVKGKGEEYSKSNSTAHDGAHDMAHRHAARLSHCVRALGRLTIRTFVLACNDGKGIKSNQGSDAKGMDPEPECKFVQVDHQHQGWRTMQVS